MRDSRWVLPFVATFGESFVEWAAILTKTQDETKEAFRTMPSSDRAALIEFLKSL